VAFCAFLWPTVVLSYGSTADRPATSGGLDQVVGSRAFFAESASNLPSSLTTSSRAPKRGIQDALRKARADHGLGLADQYFAPTVCVAVLIALQVAKVAAQIRAGQPAAATPSAAHGTAASIYSRMPSTWTWLLPWHWAASCTSGVKATFAKFSTSTRHVQPATAKRTSRCTAGGAPGSTRLVENGDRACL